MNKKVECKNCNWIGTEEDLIVFFDEVEMSNLEKCPECEDAWSLIEDELSE